MAVASSSAHRRAVPAAARRLRGPLALAVVYAVPAFLWASALPLGPRFADPTTALGSLAVLCALVGMASFACNLVLGGRVGPLPEFFGGLDRMYALHQINGRIAYLLLLAHAVLITASRATVSLDAAVGLYLPGTGWTVAFGILALTAMTVSIVLTLFGRLNHEWFVYVQRSFGFIFVIGALHAFLTPGAKASSPVLTFYLSALCAAGLGAWAYRSLFDDVLVRRHDYWVSSVRQLDPSVMEITMTPKEEPLRYRPGQFVFVTFVSRELKRQLAAVTIVSEGPSEVITFRAGDITHQFHPFSITSAPGQPELKVVVKAVGDYTRAMRALERGATARVEGPYGEFSYQLVSNAKQIWVAGGIGVTPFLSMARSLLGSEVDVDLFYCVKTRDEAYFADEFRAVQDATAALRVFLCVEQEEGFITAEYIEERAAGLADRDVLICGPPAMIDNLRGQLEARGVPRRAIHYELFGFVR